MRSDCAAAAMTDKLTKEQRSSNMSRIKRSNTKPELIVKSRLSGFEYSPKGLYGNPDFIDWKNKTVLFVDGCFWHKCPRCFKLPSSNRSFWKNKIDKNELRGKEVAINYKKSGWRVIRIWEHSIK